VQGKVAGSRMTSRSSLHTDKQTSEASFEFDWYQCTMDIQGQTGPTGYLAFARWVGWSGVRWAATSKCWSRSNDLLVNGGRV